MQRIQAATAEDGQPQRGPRSPRACRSPRAAAFFLSVERKINSSNSVACRVSHSSSGQKAGSLRSSRPLISFKFMLMKSPCDILIDGRVRGRSGPTISIDPGADTAASPRTGPFRALAYHRQRRPTAPRHPRRLGPANRRQCPPSGPTIRADAESPKARENLVQSRSLFRPRQKIAADWGPQSPWASRRGARTILREEIAIVVATGMLLVVGAALLGVPGSDGSMDRSGRARRRRPLVRGEAERRPGHPHRPRRPAPDAVGRARERSPAVSGDEWQYRGKWGPWAAVLERAPRSAPGGPLPRAVAGRDGPSFTGQAPLRRRDHGRVPREGRRANPNLRMPGAAVGGDLGGTGAERPDGRRAGGRPRRPPRCPAGTRRPLADGRGQVDPDRRTGPAPAGGSGSIPRGIPTPSWSATPRTRRRPTSSSSRGSDLDGPEAEADDHLCPRQDRHGDRRRRADRPRAEDARGPPAPADRARDRGPLAGPGREPGGRPGDVHVTLAGLPAGRSIAAAALSDAMRGYWVYRGRPAGRSSATIDAGRRRSCPSS